jgi:hypothetical protein
MGKTHLVIPDSHAHPDHPNDRFTWLGKLIADVKPDVVIDIGDMADMASLCDHATAAEIEGGRYRRDVDAALDAEERIEHEIRKTKKKRPRKVKCLGNHDVRADRFVERNPRFAGVISKDDLCPKDFKWEVHDFLEPARVDGIAYAHYFVSGVMQRPIGGINPARKQVLSAMESCTSGHSHLFDYACLGGNTGKKYMGAVVGCYVDYAAGYAGVANALWDRGVLIKRNVENGIYEHQWISIDTIRKEYS